MDDKAREIAEGVVAYVAQTCEPLRRAGESTVAPLAYALGSLMTLRGLDLMTESEFEEWMGRVADASGEDEPFAIGG